MNHTRLLCAVAIVASAVIASGQTTRDKTISAYVGILEDDHSAFSEVMRFERRAPASVSKERMARILFVKDPRGWTLPSTQQFRQAPRQFTVAFDGRSLGEITIGGRRQRDDSLGYEIGTLAAISSGSALPEIGKPSTQFGGALGFVARRPLVLVSPANFSDPDGWKRAPGALPPAVLQQVRRAFMRQFSNVETCGSSGTRSHWQYGGNDVVEALAYSSQKGAFLIQTKLNRESGCDPPRETNNAWAGQWFVVRPDMTVTYLGGLMTLIDAGDYDNDGKSEVLFAVAAGNADGYRLFYDDFIHQARLDWDYGPN